MYFSCCFIALPMAPKRVNFGSHNICSFWLEPLCQVQKNYEANLFFPEKKWLFFLDQKKKKNVLLRGFFVPGIMFFSLKDAFSWGFILWPTINLYILIGSVNSWPLSLPCIGPGIPKGQQPFGQNVTTFKVSKKKSLYYLSEAIGKLAFVYATPISSVSMVPYILNDLNSFYWFAIPPSPI